MKPYYEHAGITIYHGDCRDVLPLLSDVNLVAMDPPYNGVLDEDWDNKWESDAEFLEWLGYIVGLVDRVTTDNSTVYSFASPRLASRVEIEISRQMSVISNVVWDKCDGRKGAAGSGVDVSALRTYWMVDTERIIVAEKMVNASYVGADEQAREKCGYWSLCELSKRSIIGDYLRDEFKRAGVTNREVAQLFPSRSGGLTGCVSNWLLGFNIPTRSQYEAIRAWLNRNGDEYLRREYEDLRREYEDLRRPFCVEPHHQWGSVWRFPIERIREHPAQKPLALMSQIVAISSRVGDVVVDPFIGSGTTLLAAKRLGRKAVGVELNEKYCEIAARRLSQEVLPLECVS